MFVFLPQILAQLHLPNQLSAIASKVIPEFTLEINPSDVDSQST